MSSRKEKFLLLIILTVIIAAFIGALVGCAKPKPTPVVASADAVHFVYASYTPGLNGPVQSERNVSIVVDAVYSNTQAHLTYRTGSYPVSVLTTVTPSLFVVPFLRGQKVDVNGTVEMRNARRGDILSCYMGGLLTEQFSGSANQVEATRNGQTLKVSCGIKNYERPL